MPDLGDYKFEVLAAYAVTFAIFGILVAVTWRRSVDVKKNLEQAESRRSDA